MGKNMDNNKMIFCTLFDSNYLDRGLVMYESMEKNMDNFVLYVIAFDEKCAEILLDRKLEHMVVIPYEEFEDDTLRQAKMNRDRKEFIWTCSGYSIKYILEHYQVPQCTYIDADMFFYDSPKVLFNQMEKNKSDVGIIAHGFGNHPEYKIMEKETGKYCVEFNTFYNNENGRNVLNWWVSQCLNCCTGMPDGEHFGDQKYLDEFKRRFIRVYEHNEIGAGVAPWNLDRFTCEKNSKIKDKKTKEISKIIFCHYHSLEFIGENTVNINVFIRPGRHDKKLVYQLYRPYVSRLVAVRKMLTEKYGISWNSKKEYIEKGNRCAMIKDFLTSEPNFIFLIRKIVRFIFNKKLDFITVNS